MLFGANQIGRVLQDGIGFGKREIPIHHSRYRSVRVDREKFGFLMRTSEIVDML
jgi:hypothetical protein